MDSCQLTQNINAVVISSVKTELIAGESPLSNSWPTESRSFVMRLIRSPIGWRSKKRSDRFCVCSKTSLRRRYIASWGGDRQHASAEPHTQEAACCEDEQQEEIPPELRLVAVGNRAVDDPADLHRRDQREQGADEAEHDRQEQPAARLQQVAGQATQRLLL
jgi:hypothetical protein